MREWLAGQAAGGNVSYDAGDRAVLVDRGAGPGVRRPGRTGASRRVPAGAGLSGRPADRSWTRSGPAAGVAWGDHHPDVFTGIERFFRPGYVANLVSSWIPAVDRPGGAVADGHPRGRRRLRPGSVDPHPGRHLPGLDGRSGSTRTEDRSSSPGRRPPRKVWPTGAGSTWRGRRTSPVRATDWWRRSTPARHGRPGRRRPPHPVGPGRGRRLADRRTVRAGVGRGEPEPGRAGVLLVLHVPVRAARPSPKAPTTRWATRPARHPSVPWWSRRASARFERVAETPFNLVYAARPDRRRNSAGVRRTSS